MLQDSKHVTISDIVQESLDADFVSACGVNGTCNVNAGVSSSAFPEKPSQLLLHIFYLYMQKN